MQKTGVCAVILGIFICVGANAGNTDCVKFLCSDYEKICMRTIKETSPSLAVQIDDTVYYVNATTENRGNVKFEYNGRNYSLYNEIEYELIHWLSGTDALVNGVWRDRIRTYGAMDFVNHGCVWNDASDGYYSSDGLAQFFQTASVPTIDFGTDWYVEIIARVGTPLGTSCYVIDLSALGNVKQGNGLSISSATRRISANTKPNGDVSGLGCNTGDALYTWDDRSIFTFGVNQYSDNQSRAFIKWDGNRYYGNPFDTVQWNRWSFMFYLFRGITAQWTNNQGFLNIYQCGPTTIYDIKVWRRK